MLSIFLFTVVFIAANLFIYQPKPTHQFSSDLSTVEIISEFALESVTIPEAEITEATPEPAEPEQAEEVLEVDGERLQFVLKQTKKLILHEIKRRGIWVANAARCSKGELARVLVDWEVRNHTLAI